jgi:hypothetical protein
LEDHLDELAHHYGRSDNTAKAVEYLGRAGQQAAQRSAYGDAIRNLAAAIDLLHKLPDSPERTQRELQLQLAVGPALIAIRQHLHRYAQARSSRSFQATSHPRQTCNTSLTRDAGRAARRHRARRGQSLLVVHNGRSKGRKLTLGAGTVEPARRASNSLRAWSRWSSEPSKRQRKLDRHRLASLSGTETQMPVRTTHTSGKFSSAGLKSIGRLTENAK